MRVTVEQREMMDAMRNEACTAEQKEHLIDVMVSKTTAINLQGLLHETAFATIPNDVLVTYIDEAVRGLCGTRGQNRRSLRILAELIMVNQHAATRMLCDSGAPENLNDLQTRTQLAISLTAETRRLLALLEQMRQGLEDRYEHKKTKRLSSPPSVPIAGGTLGSPQKSVPQKKTPAKNRVGSKSAVAK